MNIKMILFIPIFISFALCQSLEYGYGWYISSDFGPRNIGASLTYDFHEGIDYGRAYGDDDLGEPIPAVESGNITFIRTDQDFKTIIVCGDQTGDYWLYGHIFKNDNLNINNMQAINNAPLLNDQNEIIMHGNVIVFWQGNRVLKILSTSDNAGLQVSLDGNVILGTDNQPQLTENHVETGEIIAPMGRSGTDNVHLHLGLNYPNDNPFYHVIHNQPNYATMGITYPAMDLTLFHRTGLPYISPRREKHKLYLFLCRQRKE